MMFYGCSEQKDGKLIVDIKIYFVGGILVDG